MILVEGIARYFAKDGSAVPLRDAFARRSAVMPFRGKQRLPGEDIQAAWQRLSSHPSQRQKRLAYIHVPFCANHCLFCGFYRNAYVPDVGATYTDRVIEEIRREASAPAVAGNPIHAVYLGGGTPTALSATELSRLIATVRAELPLAADCEITVEGRIIHFDPEKIDACLEAGANRFSIGIQSFNTDVRRRQGRRSSREEAITFLENLRDRDRAALVIDLMYGLPGQTLDVWQQDLQTAAAIAPDGIDLYGLNLIPGTPLFTAINAGKFPSAPGLSEIGEYYRVGVEFFRQRSWRQISNNHWGRATRERNLYNLLIKEGADCIAFGSGAGGTIGTHSYALTGDLKQYDEDVSAGRKPLGMMAVSDDLQPLRNMVTAGFEVGHLELGRLDILAGCEMTAVLRPLLTQWQRAGLLSFPDNVIDLTVAGRFWYGNLVSAFHDIVENTLRPSTDAV
ncbi:heme anaerobic degradation radical SAM methyltransferase ChuW/HutW [Rhizobium sp. TRM96647]|nr:heme anaerobic degradation radical SAM methyltransferase ChuW/HutW [Rhizobium sp. TRM96647]MCV3760390.1 heme anaerobic degradation radical SAM methyltransferase ChuW/HutW [Rhizobium sp. TRM96650]